MSFVALRWSALAIVPWAFGAMLVAAGANSTGDSSRLGKETLDRPLSVYLTPDIYERQAWLGAQTPLQEALWGQGSLSFDPGISPREDLKKSMVQWPEVNRARKNRVGVSQNTQPDYFTGIFAQKELYFKPALTPERLAKEDVRTSYTSRLKLSVMQSVSYSHSVFVSQIQNDIPKNKVPTDLKILSVHKVENIDLEKSLFAKYSFEGLYQHYQHAPIALHDAKVMPIYANGSSLYALSCFAEKLYHSKDVRSIDDMAKGMLVDYVKSKKMSTFCAPVEKSYQMLSHGYIVDMARWQRVVQVAQHALNDGFR